MARTGKGTEKSRERITEVLEWAKRSGKSQIREGKGISQAEFADRISNHLTIGVKQQYISAYAKGREIPQEVAEAIEKEFGFRAAWLLGFDDAPKTVFEESTIRISEIRDKTEKQQMLFSLLADLNGWAVEDCFLPVAAPMGGEQDVTESHSLMLANYATVTRDGSTVTLDRVQFDKLVTRMLGIFDVEIQNA